MQHAFHYVRHIFTKRKMRLLVSLIFKKRAKFYNIM